MKKLFIALAFVGTAQAATQNIDINGTVSSVCSFNSVNNGTLALVPGNPNQLATNTSGGTNASFAISYNATPTISVNEITSFTTVPSGFADSVVFNNVLTSANSGPVSYSSGVASMTQSSGTNDVFTLTLGAFNAANSFPLGNYSASTTVTCQ